MFLNQMVWLLRDSCAKNLAEYLKEHKGIEMDVDELVGIMLDINLDKEGEQMTMMRKFVKDAEDHIREEVFKSEMGNPKDFKKGDVEQKDKKLVRTEKKRDVVVGEDLEEPPKVDKGKEPINPPKTPPKEEEEKDMVEKDEPVVEETPKVEKVEEKTGCCYILGRANKKKKKGDRCDDPTVKGENYCKKHMKYKKDDEIKSTTEENKDEPTPSVVSGMVATPNEEEEMNASIRALTEEDLVVGIGDYKGYQYETNMGYLLKHLPSGDYLAEFIKKGKDDIPRALTPDEKEKAIKNGFAVIRDATPSPTQRKEEVVEEKEEERQEDTTQEEPKEEEKKEEENPMMAKMMTMIKFMEENMPGFKEKPQEEKLMQAMAMMNNMN